MGKGENNCGKQCSPPHVFVYVSIYAIGPKIPKIIITMFNTF